MIPTICLPEEKVKQHMKQTVHKVIKDLHKPQAINQFNKEAEHFPIPTE